MTKKIVWALAINATQARILRGVNRTNSPSEPELVLKTEHHNLREIMSDKPGRSFSSAGPGRSSMEYASDPVRDAEKAFAEKAVALLEQHRQAGDFTHLAIFAAPEMMGLLRPALTKGLAATLMAEVPKNLLHESEHDLPRVVADHLFGA